MTTSAPALLRAGAGAGVLVALCAVAVAGQEAPVRLDVEGVGGALRDNVLASVSVGRTPRGSRLTEARVRALLERAPREVRTALEPFGYYQATVRDSLRYDRGRWLVLLSVSSGPPVLLAAADVRITGPGAEDAELLETMRRAPLATGSPLSHADYESLKTRLATTAAERGYLDAAFDSAVVRVDRDARTARVVLRLRTGPRYTLGPVTFVQDVLDPAILQSLVPWQPGAPFDGAQLLALRGALTEGSYFSGVEIIPRRDRAEGLVVPIEVVLTPSRPQRYSVGAGYGSDTGPRGTLSVELRRLNEAGHRAELDTWVSPVERRVSGRYLVPLRTRRAGLLSFSAGFVDENPSTSDTETWIVGTNVAGLWGAWRSEIGLTFQRAHFEVGTQSGVTKLTLLGTGISRVRADDRLDPTRGSLLRLHMRAGHDALFGDVRLLDGGAEARLIVSPTPQLRLRTRAEIAALATSSFARLPGSIRYFAGGDRSIRGYGYRALGPKDDQGNPIGGSRLLVGSVEAEWRLLESWGVAVFADGGNALTSFSDPLEAGMGAGLRWRSPIGMVRLDGAFAVTEPGAPFRLHLHLGPEL